MRDSNTVSIVARRQLKDGGDAPDDEEGPRKVAGFTLPDWAKRTLAGVLTAILIGLGSVSFSVYNNTASNTKDIAYLLKRDEQDYAALVELAKELQEVRESREDQAQMNREFHAQAIAKINELLTRDRYRTRGRER